MFGRKRRAEIDTLRGQVDELGSQLKEFAENAATKEQKPPQYGEVKAIVDEDHITTELNENLGEGQDKVDKAAEMGRIDPKLKGYVGTRILALIGLKREITGDDEVADFVRGVFSGFRNFSETLRQVMNDALRLGSAFPEYIWVERDGKIVIERIEVRSPGKFKFGKKNELLMVGGDKEVAVDERRVAPLTFEGVHGNRYGSGLYNTIYWNNFIKKNLKEFWAIGIEKYNVPIAVATDEGAGPEARQAVDQFIQNIKFATGIVLPKEIAVKFLETARQVGSSEEKYLDYLDSENAIAILGQTLTSNVGKVGSFAAAKIHDLVRKDILLSDITMMESYLNDLVIKTLVDLNFQNVESYPKWRVILKDDVNMEVMINVIVMLIQNGFDRIPISWIHQLFGIPIPREGEETLKPVRKVPAVGQEAPENFSEEWRDVSIKYYLEQLRKLHG